MVEKFPMHRAAREGDLDGVRELIEGGVSVDSLDYRQRSPLHWAAERGRDAVAQLLISSKCDIDIVDRDGSTPVLLAADKRNKRLVNLLLQHGAQVNCVEVNDKWTLLHYACARGWTNQVRSILDRGGADLDAANGDGDTPLSMAIESGLDDIAVLLIRAGADVNRRDSGNSTALHWAAFDDHTRVVQELLKKKGLDLNPRDDEGDTPLHFACFQGRREVAIQLLVAGADTTIKNNEGETALSEGIRKRRLTLEDVRLFVQHGLFLQERDYVRISQDPVLKEGVQKDVGLCTQSIVNKFHRQSLPALKSMSYFARQLPNIDNFKLNARQVEEVENFVRCEIGRNTFCNVVKAHPMALSVLCVLSLITCQSGTN